MDLGSNSVKVMVARKDAKGGQTLLFDENAGTRLGEGVQKWGALQPQAIERTLNVLEEMVRRTSSLGINEWRAVATSAVRGAKNREDFRQKFEGRMAFPLHILEGETEAEWIFQGVASDRGWISCDGSVLVCDCGGGSVELIRGEGSKMSARLSLPLGAVRMTEQFIQENLPSMEGLDQLEAYFEEMLQVASQRVDLNADTLIATGGGIYVTAALLRRNALQNGELIHGTEISRTELETFLVQLRTRTREERIEQLGVPPDRADILPAGILLYLKVITLLRADRLKVSQQGLRHGVLLQKSFPRTV